LHSLVFLVFQKSSRRWAYATTYSDVWISGDSDTYDDNAPTEGQVWGMGTTEDMYNSYGHDYWVITTITASDGSSATTTSASSTSYAQALAVLPVGPYDYDIASEHWYYCPIGYSTVLFTTAWGLARYHGHQDVYYKLTEQVGPTPITGTIDCYYEVCIDYLRASNKTRLG